MGKLLSIRFGNAWDLPLAHAQPEQIKHQTVLAIHDVLFACARQRRLVVVLDDLHWADPLSIDVVARLSESLALAPLLLVCIYRPEEDERCRQLPAIASRACPGRSTEIVLRELAPSQSRRLIQSLLSVEALSSSLLESILVQSQGNPFFVEEIIRSLIDSGAIYRDGERWLARQDASAIEVPETLQSVIQSRVDRLETGARHLLESASVIGRTFRRRVLQSALGGQCALEEALAELEGRALICCEERALEEEYSFRHILTQQAVYQAILPSRRGRLHGKIAGAIETIYRDSLNEHCVHLAHHHEQAGNTEKAAEYLVRAGVQARDANLNEAAIQHFQRSLELLARSPASPGGIRLQALVERGKILEVVGKHSQAEAMLREASDLAHRLGCAPREIARIQYFLCKTLTSRHQPKEYVPLAEESLALLDGDTQCAEAAWAEFVVSYGSFERGDCGPPCAFATRRREFIRALPYSPEGANNCAFLAMVHFLDKNEPEAMDWLEWVEREAHGHNDLMSLAATRVRRGRDLLAQRGDLAPAIEAIERAIDLYRRIGGRYLEGRCHLYAGDIQYRFGRLEPAEECLRRAESICKELEGHAHLQAESVLLKGQIALSRGDPLAALASFSKALAMGPGDRWRWLLRLLTGRALLEMGRKKEAARSFMNVLGSTLVFRLPPAYSLTIDLAHVLSLLENCDDQGDEFRAACDLVRRKRPEARTLLVQWYLEPANPGACPTLVVVDDFRTSLAPEWSWNDPFGDCARSLEDGLVLLAAPGRGLWGSNHSAPRVLRPASGAIVLQVSCGPGQSDRPAVGGLLVWKDQRNFLRLDSGSFAPQNVAFCGSINNRDIIIGRGRLRSERPCLRLERSGPLIRALCSGDGQEWHLVGQVEFPVEDPLEVGLYADGAIRPEIYPRLYGLGSAVRFAEFRL